MNSISIPLHKFDTEPDPDGNPKREIFHSNKDWNSNFKHWAIILELSNDSLVNIQFGRNGFSLKEFNPTQIKGENILDAIINTWGQTNFPVSFCYLGDANFDYEKLKNLLRGKKEKELKSFKKKGKVYYNLTFRNCQHFVCDIEKILFSKIKVWHSFEYYFEDFFKTFFPNINIEELKSSIFQKYPPRKTNLSKKDEKIFEELFKESDY